MLRRRILERGRQDEIYPVVMTGPNSFILDGQEYTGKPQSAGKRFGVGERAYVGFAALARRLPVILAGSTKQSSQMNHPFTSATTAYARWMQSDANPGLNRRVRDNQIPFLWLDEENTLSTILADIPRQYYDDGLQGEVAWATLQGMYSAEGLVVGDDFVAALVTLYQEDNGAVVGYLVREVRSDSGTTDWVILLESTFGTLGGQYHRRQGYLFYNQVDDVLTVGHRGGITAIKRSDGTNTTQAWEASYGTLEQEAGFSAAYNYALQGAYIGFDSVLGEGAEDCAVHVYARGANWAHTHKHELPALMTDCYFIRPCGHFIPFPEDFQRDILNSRWPYLPSTQEFLVWVAGYGGGDDFGDPTTIRRKVLAIKGAVVRTLHEVHNPTPTLWTPRGQSVDQAAIEANLNAEETISPENWIPQMGGGYLDPLGREIESGVAAINPETGLPEGDSAFENLLPDGNFEDIPIGLGYGRSYAIYMRSYSGAWSTDNDPTIPGDCPRLACDDTGRADNEDFPRGIVDSSTSTYYLAERLSAWLSSGGAEVHAGAYTYAGYEDFPPDSFDDNPLTNRIFKYVSTITSVGHDYRHSKVRRCVVSGYLSSGTQMWELDLTRIFTDGGGFITRQEPWIWDMVLTSDVIWILASDWWAVDSQIMTMIAVGRVSGLELDRFALPLVDGDLVDFSGGRPQIIGGVDEGGPFVQMFARWDTGDWIFQTLRYASSAISRESYASTSADTDVAPVLLLELANAAIDGQGSAYWIHKGVSVRKALVP
jgi:hypothetical protein